MKRLIMNQKRDSGMLRKGAAAAVFAAAIVSAAGCAAFDSVLPQPVRHKAPANNSVPKSLYFPVLIFSLFLHVYGLIPFRSYRAS